ncbi:Protein of unknown function [Gryllus bimaculatus]|nr:Protein of unknown function [Gryllus bimaculatus]
MPVEQKQCVTASSTSNISLPQRRHRKTTKAPRLKKLLEFRSRDLCGFGEEDFQSSKGCSADCQQKWRSLLFNSNSAAIGFPRTARLPAPPPPPPPPAPPPPPPPLRFKVDTSPENNQRSIVSTG